MNTSSHATSVRVLTHPKPSPSLHSSYPPPIPSIDPPSSSSSSSLPTSSEGVVVVGFIGTRPEDTAHLINRILDSNVFGSGNLDRGLSIEKEEDGGIRDWFEWRRISYYHDEETGIIFLQYCSLVDGFCDSRSSWGFDSAIEENELRDLQGLLFMFSVCHVLIFIQEGMRFDTQILKKFRVLQASKHSLTPFIRSRTTPPLPSRSHPSSSSSTSSSSSRPTMSSTTPNNPSPGSRSSSSTMARNSSSVSPMSGLGSYASLFPGQCTPVLLFAFIDDIFSSEISTSTSSNIEDSTDSSSQPSLPGKGSGPQPVIVLARPVSRSEGGFRKKLQTSLETQVRLLIKRCRTLTETGHVAGATKSGTGSNSSSPLFSLDSSRAVVLVDKLTNRPGESLDFASRIVEDILEGKATSDFLLHESHGQSGTKEDVLSIKDFIFRQAEILRGRGGQVGNSNSGSAVGVGMVAVAAAAAAAASASASASAASRKTFTTPELPNMEIWLSSSRMILHGVLSSKGVSIDEVGPAKRKPRSTTTTEPFEIAVSWLENGKGLNTKFSTLWCEKSLPSAKEVYLKDLPAYYPTSKHQAHFDKALNAFRSMVKGPAMQYFTTKLEEECMSIWTAGRQLCDAVSLTSQPCVKKRHDFSEPHSSGFVFLHACACGRSRQLRPDPFDFQSANFNCFSECDKLLPLLQLPGGVSKVGPIHPSSWSLIRVGGAKYYEPSKGLLQSGFSPAHKFLSKWKIIIGKMKNPNGLERDYESIAELKVDANTERDVQIGVEKQISISDNIKPGGEKKSSIGGKDPSSNFTMRKPFSEVVAGSAAPYSGFPPLQQRKQPVSGLETDMKQSKVIANRSFQPVSVTVDQPRGPREAKNEIGDSFLRIGSNVVPMNVSSNDKLKNTSLKHVIAYIGFEHECPHGHRFQLNSEHLNGFETPYSSLGGESQIVSSVESKHVRHRNFRERHGNKSKEIVLTNNGNLYLDGPTTRLSGPGIENNRMPVKSSSIDESGGYAFSLLNKNLPVFMNCPHCKLSKKNKKDQPKTEFAGTISQLQRIFVVTPPFPIVLAASPVIQFEESCLPASVLERQQKLQFSLGCPVILPPESFITLRLPFVYGVQLEDGSAHPLNAFNHQPESTAWVIGGTTFQVLSKPGNHDEEGLQT